MPSGPEADASLFPDPTGRFTVRAEDYARYRPGYPRAAIDELLRGLGEPAEESAADVGAGTGISSRLLAERGMRVIAIEPNAAMRGAAAPHPRIEWRDGTAEATGLAVASIDLVLCAQAFHWFRAAEALVEFHRVLRPSGRLGLLWNHLDETDGLTFGYADAIRRVAGSDPPGRREFDASVVPASGRFGAAHGTTFAHEQELDREGLVRRALSESHVPRAGEPLADLRHTLEALFDLHHDGSGRVRLKHVARLFVAESR